MEIIATNPERRDPGFSENKLDIGLGKVDNISSTELFNTIVHSAKIIANEKTIGDVIQSNGESFFPIFQTAKTNSTCSLEVGFYDLSDDELASFDITFSYYDDEISYLLNVMPGATRIEDYYLRVLKKDDMMIGGIYWGSSSLYTPENNFRRIGVNLIHWTEGSKIMDPSKNKITEYNINTENTGCELIFDIPLKESSSTIDYAASSFVLYNKGTGKRLYGTDANYTTSQLRELDVPTINEVPFLLKRGTTIDGKIDARHITVPARHAGTHKDKAGGHNWDVLERIRKAGLIQNKDGAEHTIGEMLNIDDLHFGVTRLSGYDKLDLTVISTEVLSKWLDTLGYDTDVISVGLFKNFVGYLCKLIDQAYDPKVLDFSLENSAHEFIFVTPAGSTGTPIVFNTYRRDYTSGGYTNIGIFGTPTLLGFTIDDPEGIIEDVTVYQLNSTQVTANIKMTRNSSEDSKGATITFKQLDGEVPTGLPDIAIKVFQEGFATEYGILLGEDDEPLVPIFEADGIVIIRDYKQFSTTRIIRPIVTENSDEGYRILENTRTEIVLDGKTKNWASVQLDGTILTISGLKNENSYKRTGSGYLSIYDSENELLGRIPITIIQGSVDGYLELEDHFLAASKSGESVSTEVRSNYPWTIDIETVPDWISLTGFTGTRKAGTSTITFLVSENSDSVREATIKFINDFGNTDYLTISQLGKEEYFDIVGFPDTDIFLSMSPRTSGHYGRNKVILTISTDKNWVVDYKPSWIGMNYTVGPPKQNFKITLTFTGEGYNPTNVSNYSYPDPGGDYISFGYLDKETNTIVSFRKVFISLRSWGIRQNNVFTDSGTGAYLFGPTYSELTQGDKTNLYCIGDIKRLRSNINLNTELLNYHFDLDSEYKIENEPEFEYVDETWIYKEELNLGVEYPNIKDYQDKFGYFKREIKAVTSFGENHYSSLRNIESSISGGSDTITNFKIIKEGVAPIYFGIPSSTEEGRDLITVSYRRLLKAGILMKAEEGGDFDGILLSGSSQTLSLKTYPRYRLEGGQELVQLYLLNETLPGWIYFDESLTSKDNIADKTQFGETTYTLHVLPNRTEKQRSVTLQFCDRGIKDTITNYTITQNTSLLTTTRTLKSVVPVLSRKIDGTYATTIEIRPLLTWEDRYTINGSDYTLRTYREFPSYSSVNISIVSGNWFSIKSSNSRKFLEINANNEESPRVGEIRMSASDDSGNTVTGNLKIYQPSSTVQIERSVSDLEVELLNVGLSPESEVPMEFYSIGYKITGTKTIQIGEDIITEEGELFPESLDDLKVSCLTSQKFDFSTPLALIKKDPCGVESSSTIYVDFYGVTKTMTVYQELNDTPFELEYSYVQIGKEEKLPLNLIINTEDAIITENNNRIASGKPTNNKPLDFCVYVEEGSQEEANKYSVSTSSKLNLIAGSNTGNYDVNYGLSLQKPEIIKISNRNESVTHVLTVVPKPIEGRLVLVDGQNPSITGINMNAPSELDVVGNGYEIPRVIVTSGISDELGKFGGLHGSLPGDSELWYFVVDSVTPDIRNPYFYISKFPLSVIAKSLWPGYKKQSQYFSHQPAKVITEDFDPLDYLTYSEGMTRISNNEFLLRRDINEYSIQYSGIPFGASISEVNVKNNITYFLWGQTRFGNQRVPPMTNNYELVFYNYSLGSNTSIHGSYPEYQSNPGCLYITTQWGGYTGGTNNGLDLYNSGEDFVIATITLAFKCYSTEGVETIITKTITLYYEGVDIVTNLQEPSISSTSSSGTAEGELILRTNLKNQSIGIVDPIRRSWSGSGGSYPIVFSTVGNWIIYKKEGSGSWIFNGNEYSPSWSNAAGNSGYNYSLTTNTVNVKLNYDDECLDLTQYRGMTVSASNLARFEVLTSQRDTSNSVWVDKTGPSIKFKIGPALPKFLLMDQIAQQIVNEGGDLKFAYFSSSKMLRACFTITSCPYIMSTDDILSHFSREFTQQINSSGKALTIDTQYHGSLSIYPPKDWSCKLVYVPDEGKFYLSYYSIENDIISINDSNINGNPVGTYSIDLQDPYEIPGTPFILSFNGSILSGEFDINPQPNIDGEIIIFDNEVYYDSYVPGDDQPDQPSSLPELDPREDYPTQEEIEKDYYYLLEQTAYGNHDMSSDGEGTPPTLGGNYAYVLHCYDRNIQGEYYLRYSGGDNRFYYVIGTPNSMSGEGYPDESWNFTYNSESVSLATLDELGGIIKQYDEFHVLILWRTNKQYNNIGETLSVYRKLQKEWDIISVINPVSQTNLTYNFPINQEESLDIDEYRVKFITADGISRFLDSTISSSVDALDDQGESIPKAWPNNLLSYLTDFVTKESWKATVQIHGYVDQINTGAFHILHRTKLYNEVSLPEQGSSANFTNQFSIFGLPFNNTIIFSFPELTNLGEYSATFLGSNNREIPVDSRYLRLTKYSSSGQQVSTEEVNYIEDVSSNIKSSSNHKFIRITEYPLGSTRYRSCLFELGLHNNYDIKNLSFRVYPLKVENSYYFIFPYVVYPSIFGYNQVDPKRHINFIGDQNLVSTFKSYGYTRDGYRKSDAGHDTYHIHDIGLFYYERLLNSYSQENVAVIIINQEVPLDNYFEMYYDR